MQKCLTDLMDNCQQFCKAKSNQVKLKMGFNFPAAGDHDFLRSPKLKLELKVDASAQTLAFSRQSALLLQLLASLRFLHFASSICMDISGENL